MLSGVVPWPGVGKSLTIAADSDSAGLGPSRLLPTDNLPSIRVPLPKSGRFFTACNGVTITRQAYLSMPSRASLSHIRQPVLFLVGGDSLTNRDGSEPLARILPRAQRVVIPGAGHDPWLEQPEAFFDAALTFLRSGSKRAP